MGKNSFSNVTGTSTKISRVGQTSPSKRGGTEIGGYGYQNFLPSKYPGYAITHAHAYMHAHMYTRTYTHTHTFIHVHRLRAYPGGGKLTN